MAANPGIADATFNRNALQANELERRSLSQRIETLLREIFEGHEEYLGLTPD